MKNICFILACLTFLSVLPSYATKVIVNDDKDRIVYSRSSRPPKVIVNEQQVENGQNNSYQNDSYQNNSTKTSWIKTQSINNPIYNWSIFELQENIREELVGTTWNYPVHLTRPLGYNSEEIPEQNNIQNNNQNIVETTYIEDQRFNRTSREAADYYMVDMVKAPNTLVPSWVPEE